ncbi:MAG: glycerate kinase [Chloroflexota bacterium]
MYLPESFLSYTLLNSPLGGAVSRILAAAINAVDPGEAVQRHVRRDGNTLFVADRPYELPAFRHVTILGVGKASLAMTGAMGALLDPYLTDGLVVTKHAPPRMELWLPVMEGGHPVPDVRSLAAGERVIELVASLQPEDLLICLLSGGGSALMTVPVEGLTLADMQVVTSQLLTCGARIDEINTLRRHLDKVKGGGLAKLANGATVVTLILSDVVGNALEAIASGPTAPDPTTKETARAVISRYKMEKKLPAAVLAGLEQNPETPKPGDPVFDKSSNLIIGSNLTAAQAALRQAENEGLHPYLLRTDQQGEARQAAFELSTVLRWAWKTGDPAPRPACIVAGGETTVTLRGDGKGGRNLELALAAVTELADFPDIMLVTMATDGEDGPTDAAGAVVTGETYRRGMALGLNPVEYLNRNDSYSYFSALDDLLRPGPTGTNVNDLTFLFTT